MRVLAGILLAFWGLGAQAALVSIVDGGFDSSNLITDNIDGPLNQNPIYTFGPGTGLYPANSNQLPRTGVSFVGPALSATGDDRKVDLFFGGGVDVFEIGAYFGNDNAQVGSVAFWLQVWDQDDNYLGAERVFGTSNDLIDQFIGIRSDVALGRAAFYMYQRFPSPGRVSFVALDDFRIGYETSVSAVPLPASAWLFGTALAGLAGFGKRRFRAGRA